jgi:uncharacterized protein YyaL (SSP411 family)
LDRAVLGDSPEVVVIRGQEADMLNWCDALNALYAPRQLTFAVPDTEQALPGALAARKPRDNAVAYVCRGTQCSAPITSLDDLASDLAADKPRSAGAD